MKIRRYLGTNLQEAILKVKMDLGNDALILNTRKVRAKGPFKFFSKPKVEVLAAIDENAAAEKKNSVSGTEDKKHSEPEKAENIAADIKEEKINELEDKVKSMENLLQKLYDNIQSPAPVKEAASAVRPEVKTLTRQIPSIPQIFYNNLIKNEVDPELAKKVVDSVIEKVGKDAGMNEVASHLFSTISGMLGKVETIRLKENGTPTVVIFVGPTGVGKTTTLAKIAASFLLNNKKTVGMITADTFRIAAVEQLKTYAEILGIPISVIYSNTEIKDAIAGFADKDLILIDTAGRSYSNKAQFEELKTLVMLSGADEVYLVLSATTSYRATKEIISNYSFLAEYKLIFTKMDEAPTPGIVFNTKSHTGCKLSYITTGQNVPDDIEVANIDKLTKNLMGSVG